MFTVKQISTMVHMQNAMQCAVLGDDWTNTTNHNYGRAIAVEACEAMDHVGFKWWKDKEIDWEQLKMELVDILHFELCNAIHRGLIQDLGEFGFNVNPLNHAYEVSAEKLSKNDILVFLDNIAIEALQGDLILEYLIPLFKACNLTGDDVFKLYIGKNVLNRFRKDNGYKEGTYTKLWAGDEDNEVLTKVLAATSVDVLDFESVVYQKLNAIYRDLGLKL